MVAPPLSDWRFENRLPWPGVRGRRLWHHVTSGNNNSDDDDVHASDDDDHEDNDEPMRHRRPSLVVPTTVRYDVEMCESTAGHIALVLVRRDVADVASPPAADAVGAQLAIPRVLYVVDAVPPTRASTSVPMPTRSLTTLKRYSHMEPRWTMLTADTRAHSFGGAPTTTTSIADNAPTPSMMFSSVPSSEQQHVDELALVEELFTTFRATKDACILAKPPLLCARFDCRLVAIDFVRHDKSSSATAAASPLRCIVAREDGMCYIWEWSADLHTWSFLNRFCFLDNPNLKWTRPVLLFATMPCPAWTTPGSDAVETTELAWWSAETKDEPKLFVRKIQFGVEKSTFRTEIRIGSAFDVPRVRDVVTLRSSTAGLWIVSTSDGVRLRSTATLHVLHLDWKAVWGSDTNNTSAALSCVHGVTGELLVLHGDSRCIVVIALRKHTDGQHSLVGKSLLTLNDTDTPLSLASHRQFLLALRRSRVDVYSVISGTCLTSLPIPTHETPLSLWTTSSNSSRAGASAVGLFGARGYWQLRLPSGRTLAALHETSSTGAAAALRVAIPFGSTLAFDATRFALELLQSARELVSPTQTTAWDASIHSLSSPALLLATLKTQSASESPQLLTDMTELVTAIYRVTHEVIVTGRFGSVVEKRDDALLLRGLPFVTPANVDALHHLANWVLLAKRKLARLQGAVIHKGTRHVRARTVSSLSTFAEDDDVLDDPAVALSAVDDHVVHDDNADDDEVSSSQLSRKLRPMTSLQFAAGSCSTRHGAQWLAQLESLLLPPAPAPPHALLFHEERSLADFQVALSSFSKHMYFESMVRLYLLHAPTKVVPFVKLIAQFAPRLFTLSGTPAVKRSHAERALELLPPAQTLVERVRHEAMTTARRKSLAAHGLKASRTRSVSSNDGDPYNLSAKATLIVYADLLCLCGHTLEACRVLLDADLYTECVSKLLLSPDGKDSDKAVHTAVFFALLEFCVAHRNAEDLESLLAQKPPHIDALLVLRALRQLLPLQMVATSSDRGVVSVGALRKVLLRLLREHSASVRETSNQGA